MTTICLGDIHAPYEDVRSLGIAYQIIQDIQPDKIVLSGDICDMYSISSFSREPIRALKLQTELDTTREILKTIRSLSDAKITYLKGNHEDRLERYLCNHPEIYYLDNLKIESLLELDKLDIKFIEEQKEGDLVYTHGRYISKHSASSVKRELEARYYQNSVLMGHSHRIGNYNATGSKSVVQGFEIGCLCKTLDYCYQANWQQGFAVVTDNFVEQIIIKKHKTVFRGKLYK